MTAPSQSFSPTNLKSNRFLENYFDTPVLDLGDVQGTLFLDLTTSTKFKFTVVGNLTITYSDQGNVNDILELWVLNEGYTITWPSKFSLSSTTTSTQVLTYFELRRVGSVWSSINYKSFSANPYVAVIPCPCICASSTASSSDLCPPYCGNANAFKYTGAASICCLSSCTTCCCIIPANIATCTNCQGNGSQSFNATYINLGKVLNGFNCYQIDSGQYENCCRSIYGLGYYRPSAGTYIPFGYCLCNYYYRCWDGGAYRHGTTCCTWPLGFDDNGVYYQATSHQYCFTYNSVGTNCHTFAIEANCITSLTEGAPSVPTFYYCVYCKCRFFACCDGSQFGNGAYGTAYSTYLRWLSSTQGMIVGAAQGLSGDTCFTRTTVHFKCTGSYSYCSTTSNDVILSKAHTVPYFVSLCCIQDQATNNYHGLNVYWRILWDCNWECSTAVPNMCQALSITHTPCVNASTGLSYYCEPPILTGDGCYVISMRVPLMCSGTGWWCGTGCCTTNCSFVEIYCRCANSCFFCTTPCVFSSSYTDTSNYKYVSKLRNCCINPWIDGQRGKNWWIENVEVVCRVSGTYSCYAICFNSSAGCWEVSSLSYSCICQLNGYDWFCSNQRANGSVPHIPYGPVLDSGGSGFQSTIFGCANQVPMCCCDTYNNTTPGGCLKTNWNFSPNEISPATNLASSSITERTYTGRPYVEKFRG